MFELSMTKQAFLPYLTMVAGAVDKRQSLAILSNILFEVKQGILTLTATDLEIQISASFPVQHEGEGAVTVSCRKLMEIVRSLDEDISFVLKFEDKRSVLRALRSQFLLTTLPALDFPKSTVSTETATFLVDREVCIQLFQSTYFAMSQQQDVRVFLNGLFIEVDENSLTAVSMDGHRMAVSKMISKTGVSHLKVLLPRKSVLEILRLLQMATEKEVQFSIGSQGVSIKISHYILISKLLEARFPPYARVIPRDSDKFVVVKTEVLKRALVRISILANEKSKAIQLVLQKDGLTLVAHNQEQEEATETIEAKVTGDSLKIGINASYLLDVLNYFQDGDVRLSFSDMESSILVEVPGNDQYLYIIMPMKL